MSHVDRKLDHMTQMLQQVLQLQLEHQLQPSNQSSLAHDPEQKDNTIETSGKITN